jgi:hypothetical protein
MFILEKMEAEERTARALATESADIKIVPDVIPPVASGPFNFDEKVIFVLILSCAMCLLTRHVNLNISMNSR